MSEDKDDLNNFENSQNQDDFGSIFNSVGESMNDELSALDDISETNKISSQDEQLEPASTQDVIETSEIAEENETPEPNVSEKSAIEDDDDDLFKIDEPEEEFSQDETDEDEVISAVPAEEVIQEVEKPSYELIDEDEHEEYLPTQTSMVTVRPVRFQTFEEEEKNRARKHNLDIMQDVSLHMSVELGRTKSTIKEVMELKKGSIVELDKIAGELVEVFINEKLVAKGEVMIIDENFGVRVTTVNLQKQN